MTALGNDHLLLLVTVWLAGAYWLYRKWRGLRSVSYEEVVRATPLPAPPEYPPYYSAFLSPHVISALLFTVAAIGGIAEMTFHPEYFSALLRGAKEIIVWLYTAHEPLFLVPAVMLWTLLLVLVSVRLYEKASGILSVLLLYHCFPRLGQFLSIALPRKWERRFQSEKGRRLVEKQDMPGKRERLRQNSFLVVFLISLYSAFIDDRLLWLVPVAFALWLVLNLRSFGESRIRSRGLGRERRRWIDSAKLLEYRRKRAFLAGLATWGIMPPILVFFAFQFTCYSFSPSGIQIWRKGESHLLPWGAITLGTVGFKTIRYDDNKDNSHEPDFSFVLDTPSGDLDLSDWGGIIWDKELLLEILKLVAEKSQLSFEAPSQDFSTALSGLSHPRDSYRKDVLQALLDFRSTYQGVRH